jgi:WD40 repeat protein
LQLAQRRLRTSTTQTLILRSREVRQEKPQLSVLLASLATEVPEPGDPQLPALEQNLQDALASIGGVGLGRLDHRVVALDVSKDGHWLAAGGDAGTISFWELPSATVRHDFPGHHEQVRSVLFHGSLLVTVGTRRLLAWQVPSGKQPATPVELCRIADAGDAEEPGAPVTVSGNLLAVQRHDGQLEAWNLDELAKSFGACRPRRLRGLNFRLKPKRLAAAAGRWVAACDPECGQVLVWRVDGSETDGLPMELPTTIEEPLLVQTPAQGEWLAVAGGATIELWKLSEAPWRSDQPQSGPPGGRPWQAEVRNEYNGVRGTIHLVAFSPDSKYLAVAWRVHGTSIDVWRMSLESPPQTERQSFHCDDEAPWRMRFSPDGFSLLFASRTHPPRVYNQSPDGDLDEAEDRLVGHREVERVASFGDRGPNRFREQLLNAVTFSDDSKWLATAGKDHTCRVWETPGPIPGESSIVLPGHDEEVTAVRFAPDHNHLYTGSSDGTVRRWQRERDAATSPAVLRERISVGALFFSQNSRWLISLEGTGNEVLGGGGSWKLWQLSSLDDGWPQIAATNIDVHVAAPPAQGRWLVVTKSNKTLLIDLNAADPFQSPVVLGSDLLLSVHSAFSPSGDALWTWSEQHGNQLWNLHESKVTAVEIELPSFPEFPGSFAVSNFDQQQSTRWLVARDSTDRLLVWQVSADGRVKEPFSMPEAITWRFTRTPDRILTTISGETRLWRLTSVAAKEQFVFPGVDRWSGVDQQGYCFIETADDSTELWRLVADAAPRLLSPAHNATAWAIDRSGKTICFAEGEGTLRRWKLAGSGATAVGPSFNHGGQVVGIYSDSAHERLVSVGESAARIWRLDDPDPTRTQTVFSTTRAKMTCGALSPDGRWLAAGDEDGWIQLWCMKLEDLRRVAATAVGRDFLTSERELYLPPNLRERRLQPTTRQQRKISR